MSKSKLQSATSARNGDLVEQLVAAAEEYGQGLASLNALWRELLTTRGWDARQRRQAKKEKRTYETSAWRRDRIRLLEEEARSLLRAGITPSRLNEAQERLDRHLRDWAICDAVAHLWRLLDDDRFEHVPHVKFPDLPKPREVLTHLWWQLQQQSPQNRQLTARPHDGKLHATEISALTREPDFGLAEPVVTTALRAMEQAMQPKSKGPGQRPGRHAAEVAVGVVAGLSSHRVRKVFNDARQHSQHGQENLRHGRTSRSRS